MVDDYTIHPTTPSPDNSLFGTFRSTLEVFSDPAVGHVSIGSIVSDCGREEPSEFVRFVDVEAGDTKVYDVNFVARWWGETGHGYKHALSPPAVTSATATSTPSPPI
ncbi:hypothetical protein TrRE_jg666, partial [Triparma retinervis]